MLFASTQPNFEYYFNSGSDPLAVNQIISFCIIRDNIKELKRKVINSLEEDKDVFFYVDNIELNYNNVDLITDNEDEDIEIRIEHSLIKQKYPIGLIDNSDFKELITIVIVLLKIKDLIKIIRKISVYFLNDKQCKFEASVLFSNDCCLTESTINWIPVLHEKYFQRKKALAIPYLLPQCVLSLFTEEIFLSFFDSIANKTISNNKFIFQTNNDHLMTLDPPYNFNSRDIDQIYSIFYYVFADNFLTKLQILRDKITSYIINGYKADEIPWSRVLEYVQNDHHYYLRNKMDNFFKQRKSLEENAITISLDITREIVSVLII